MALWKNDSSGGGDVPNLSEEASGKHFLFAIPLRWDRCPEDIFFSIMYTRHAGMSSLGFFIGGVKM